MAQAKAKTTTTTPAPVKQGQQAKQPAPVLPAVPNGYTGTVAQTGAPGVTCKAAGVAPQAGYPQGNAKLALAPLPANAGAQLQKNHAAVAAAIKAGHTTAQAAAAHMAANGWARNSRRPLRQLARAGYLHWQA